MIDITEVSWENILGYSNYTSKISLQEYEGVCFIHGEHEGNDLREDGDERLSGSGKSSIVEVLVWCLFGHLTKKMNPGDAIINWHTGKNARARIKTSDNYEIIRMRKFEGNNELLVFKDGVDITRSTSKPAQQFINDTFKIDYNTFIRSRIFAQSSIGFMGLTESKMRAVLEKVMCIDNINPISQTAKSKSDGVSKEIDILKSKIESIDIEIESILGRVEELKIRDSDFIDLKKAKIDNIRKDMIKLKSDLDKSIQEADNKINKKNEEKNEFDYVNIKKLKKEWDDHNNYVEECVRIEKSIKQFDESIRKLENEILKINTILESYVEKEKYNIEDITNNIKIISKNNQNIELLNSKKSELNLDINRYQLLISQENEFLNSEFEGVSKCPNCRHELTKDYIVREKNNCQESISRYDEEILKLKNKINIINDKILELKEKNDDIEVTPLKDALKYNAQIDKEIEVIEENKNNLNNLKTQLNKLNTNKISLLSDTNSEVVKPHTTINEAEAVNKYIDSIDNEINNYNTLKADLKLNFKKALMESNLKIKNINNEDSPFLIMMNEEQNKIINKKEEKENINLEIKEKRLFKMHIDYIKDSYGNKNKIKAYWIGSLVPNLNRYLKYYLDYFEIPDKLEFNESLTPKMDRWSYTTHSGGECMKIDLCLMFAIDDLQVVSFGPQSNIMVLDEVDGKFDPFTINKLVSLLNEDIIKREDGPANIFIISHRVEMKDRFPHKIRVKNKQERAYIEYE